MVSSSNAGPAGSRFRPVRYELLTLGDELLLGLTANGHLSYVGSQLGRRGVLLQRNVTVTDEAGTIEQEVRRSLAESDVVIVTGGLGPTVDDRTREAVAAVLGCGLWSLLSLRMPPRAAAVCTAALVACLLVPDAKPKFSPPIDFATQGKKFRQLAVGIPPDARVVGVSAPEFFLHTGRRNGWKWPYLWFGVDEFAAAHHEGGFAGILADLEANPPALMLVARLWTGPERAAFERWAATRYDVTTVRIFPHLRRPLRVYRPKPATPAQ